MRGSTATTATQYQHCGRRRAARPRRWRRRSRTRRTVLPTCRWGRHSSCACPCTWRRWMWTRKQRWVPAAVPSLVVPACVAHVDWDFPTLLRPVVESPWSHFTSECQRFGHPPRLNNVVRGACGLGFPYVFAEVVAACGREGQTRTVHENHRRGSWRWAPRWMRGRVCTGSRRCTSQPVRRPFPSWDRSMLAEISLCHACSCHEILRTETAGQGAPALVRRCNDTSSSLWRSPLPPPDDWNPPTSRRSHGCG
jgi:hypothetical protein